MTDRELDRRIAELYAREALSEEALERMLSASARRPRRPAALWALAAAILLGAALVPLVGPRLVERDPARVTRAVAAEILRHDARHEPLDVESGDVAVLRASMRRLDFALVEPRALEAKGWRLLGARYCSIRGRLAAQLRLRDASGTLVNLYQCPARERLRRVESGAVVVGGSRVVFWKEGSVLLGMAEVG